MQQNLKLCNKFKEISMKKSRFNHKHLSLSNVTGKHRITIDASAECIMKVYSLKQITKFIEFGNRLQGLNSSNNSFFEEYNKAIKKIKFNDHIEVMPDKRFSV